MTIRQYFLTFKLNNNHYVEPGLWSCLNCNPKWNIEYMVNYLSFCPTCTKAFKTFPLTEKDRLDLYDKFMSLTNIKQDTNLFKLQSSTNHYVSKKNKLSFYTTYFHIEELY